MTKKNETEPTVNQLAITNKKNDGVTRNKVRKAQEKLDRAAKEIVAAARILMEGEGTRKEVMSCLNAAGWLDSISGDLYYFELNPPRRRETALGKEIKELFDLWGVQP